MYLSPDERFLVSTLYDLSVDPQKEVGRIANNVSKLLMRDDSPKLAGADNRITLVEFVDFECPYCKQFADWYSALPASLQRQTTLVFKNLPLPQHPWAHSAAVYAVCANSQSPAAFRQLITFLFDSQSQITPQNLKQKALESLRQSNALDSQQFEACVSGKDASEVVDRDVAIAKQLNVSNTPTLFVNGRRVLRVASKEELQHLLETELSNIDSTTAQTHAVNASR
jgi:protein-disulfide isomerase